MFVCICGYSFLGFFFNLFFFICVGVHCFLGYGGYDYYGSGYGNYGGYGGYDYSGYGGYGNYGNYCCFKFWFVVYYCLLFSLSLYK